MSRRRPKEADADFVRRAPDVEPAAAAAPAMPLELDIAVVEVLGLPMRWLRELPLPSTLVCRFRHGDGRVVLASAADSPSAPGEHPPAPVFVGPELDALALAAEHDRAGELQLRAWCAKKPDWRLTPIEAIGLPGPRPEPRHWTTGRVLGALGLQLEEVRL